MRRILVFLLAAVMLLSVTAFVGCKGKDDRIVIKVDGGGVSGNYNSSISMKPSPSNPNPYNQLELLAEEWNKTNTEYKVQINRTSVNGNRDSLLGYFTTKSGPDIIYQTATNLSEDLGKGYFVDMTDYLDAPNKYLKDNAKWSSVYVQQELEASRAADGNFYSIGIDRNVAGIMYNKTLFKQAGVDENINTFSDLMNALEKLEANNIEFPYLEVDNWYDIVLEGNMYGSQMEAIDTIRPNGVLDTEELCRAYNKGLYKLKNGNNIDKRYQAYLELIAAYGKKLPTSNAGLNATTEFANGKAAMVSCLGIDMNRMYIDPIRQQNFEMGIIGYPNVTQADIEAHTSFKNGEVTVPENNGVRRGISGIGTGWWITNSAMKKETVSACVDFLQFVTAPENNGRLVNKLGVALPLDMQTNGDSVSDVYQQLVDQNVADAEKNYYVWHVFNTWGIMGFDYWSKFTVEDKNIKRGDGLTSSVNNLNDQFDRSYKNLLDRNTTNGAWNPDLW